MNQLARNPIFLLFFVALLSVQCQKDDRNTDVESEQLKKELSRAELEKRVMEIYNSQEYKDFRNYYYVDLLEDYQEGDQLSEEENKKSRYYENKLIEKFPDYFSNKDIISLAFEMQESGRMEIMEDSTGRVYEYRLISVKKINKENKKK